MSNINVEAIIKKAERLFNSSERTVSETQWSNIAEFVLTNQSGIFHSEEAKGVKKTSRVYDSLPLQAAQDLAAAIHSVMTNPATAWMRLRWTNEALNSDPSATEWLQNAEDKMLSAFNSSNFTNEVSKAYRFFVALGNMTLMHEQDGYSEDGSFKGFRFKALHLAETAWSEDARGSVDTIYRKFPLTARQAIERFGDKVSEIIKKAVEETPDKEFKFIHCIFPQEDKVVPLGDQVPAKDRPYLSVYVEMQTKQLVQEDGYYEFPALVTRWETLPGEVYGRGPGHIAYPDVRTLNKLKSLSLHAIAKAIDPPVLVTQRALFGNLDLRPHGVTTVRDLEKIKPFESGARFDVTNLVVKDLQESIQKSFFLDKLLLPPRTETGEMTAFEVSQRVEQMQRVLGPTLGRLNSELLDPLVKRAFNIMFRGRAFAPLPSALQEIESGIQIEYINPLARSQRISDVTSIQSWIQDLLVLAQALPEAIDYIDTDGVAKLVADIRGVPIAAIKDDEEVKAIREQRAQAQQAQQALEAGVKAADIQAKTSGNGGQGDEEPSTF